MIGKCGIAERIEGKHGFSGWRLSPSAALPTTRIARTGVYRTPPIRWSPTSFRRILESSRPPPEPHILDLQSRLQAALGDAYRIEKELGGGIGGPGCGAPGEG